MRHMVLAGGGRFASLGRVALVAVVALTAGGGLGRLGGSAARAATILVDFGNNNSFRGASVPAPDQHGNFWTSMQPGLFYSNLVDTTNTPTTVDFGFSTPVGTDSFNGPAGVTSNSPLTPAEVNA